VLYLKASASKREIDLNPDVAEYLRQYTAGKFGLLFQTASVTPHLYGNIDESWLKPRLVKMQLDQKGMRWHAFKRFRKTWLRGNRCLEDINNFWMAHKPKTKSELYSHLHQELEMRLAKAKRVDYGFAIPNSVGVIVPNVPRFSGPVSVEVAA